MATKRKHEPQTQRGALSRIPAPSSKSYLDMSSIIFAGDTKENIPQPETIATKRVKIDTSTPKPNSAQHKVNDAKLFKPPNLLGVRNQAIAKTKAVAPSRKAVPPPRPAVVAAATSTTTGPPAKTRRPAWDLKGKVSDLEEKVAVLMAQNQQKIQECHEKSTLVGDVQLRAREYQQDVVMKEQMLQDQRARLLEVEKENREAHAKLFVLEPKLTLLAAQYEVCKEELKQYKETCVRQSCELEARKADIQELKIIIADQEHSLTEEREEKAVLQSVVSRYELQLQHHEGERKKLHNMVQELKGNIRVYCRIRPLLQEENSESCMLPVDVTSLTVTKPLEHNESAKNRLNTEFKFDKVFTPDSSQETVFDEISQLVQSALDGFNVCIFAYGQTGSGKTYTMEGPAHITDFLLESDNPELGMIPRAVNQVFATARSQASRGWLYNMEVSIMEIYNEMVKDLLSTNSKTSQVSLQKGMDSAMSTTTTTKVGCEKDVYVLLKRARKNRAVAATSCNEYSSRSHSIFRLKITGENERTDEKCEAILSLVDLAGSERLRELTMDGTRLRETKNINKSLSNLGNVILALAQKADHIPYRNSKLTHILMNSLGGNSKTLMFVNVSPKEENYAESLNSLRFGTKVNNCNIGTATRMVKS